MTEHLRLQALPPFIPPQARILLLGSMPSEASLKEGFFYAHPRNRFWPIIGKLSGLTLDTLEQKKAALSALKIGLYDVILSCERQGSLDSAIRAVEPANIQALIQDHPTLKRIVLNGALAKKLFVKYNKDIKLECCFMPSTSPANAQYSFVRLYECYAQVLSCSN